eukprot:CAMPEP_0171084720 /NCGR_PEP_ID=MMETSP0766_2-20121228/18491_1 /TAXON_ID=439317 /ORGANISM="Gambierdiscus australes, Strain CAWD 149" /LENGTH=139 /DNA_ID=CAMNT_0011542239 /DNA_START=793 /DNA_END=1209 /DNA_ORIENTATION=-
MAMCALCFARQHLSSLASWTLSSKASCCTEANTADSSPALTLAAAPASVVLGQTESLGLYRPLAPLATAGAEVRALRCGEGVDDVPRCAAGREVVTGSGTRGSCLNVQAVARGGGEPSPSQADRERGTLCALAWGVATS